MERDAFLQRVRTAAQAGRMLRVAAAEHLQHVGYVGAAGDLCEALAREINAVGGEAAIVASDDAARQVVAQLLQQYSARRALLWEHVLLERLQIPELLGLHEVQPSQYTVLAKLDFASQRRQVLAADIGISSVDFAVAETGTLVVASRPGQERAASLTPPVHIALVDEAQIVPDLFDVFARLDALGWESLPSNLAFITGPSKTGDIELQLTTGVHGPGKWHVVILRGKAP